MLMKKNYRQRTLALFSMLAMLGTGQALGQTYLVSEGFEGQTFPPNGWTVIDNDGDGHCWQAVGKGQATLSGSKIAVSYTVNPDNGQAYGTQDNYLVTPKIRVTNGAYKLSFKYCAEDEDTAEKLQVLVSETGNAAADFSKVLKSITVENGYDGVQLYSAEISLADYAGKDIYIAFRHSGTNTYALGIDDVRITNEKGPKAISALTVTPGSDGKLSATLSWTNPSKNGAGENLTSDLAIGIYRDSYLLKAIGDGVVAGEKMTYADNDVTNGTHVYSLVAKTAEGESLPVSKSAYIGEDIPAAVENITVSSSKGKNTVRWTSPTTGANKGYVNPSNITYTVSRLASGEETVLADNVKGLTYEDTPETGRLTSYAITPINAAGKGAQATSGAVIAYGTPLADINVTPSATVSYANPKLPFDVSTKVSVSEMIYYPADFKYAHGAISDIVFKNAFKNSTFDKPVKIWLTETDKADLSGGWIPANDMTLVYDGTLSMNRGDNDLPLHLSTPFDYKGSNLVMLAMMEASSGTGTYFDRFYVEPLEGSATRSLSTTSYSADFDIASLGENTPDKASALPATRFVLSARGVADVKGVVTGKNTGKAVAGATVSVPDLNIIATTDADGAYELGLVRSGSHNVMITAVGYHDYSSSVTFLEGEQPLDMQIDELATVAVSGKATLQGVDSAKGIMVRASGYSDASVETAEDGSYSLSLYEGKDYELTASYPMFNNQHIAVASASANEKTDFMLTRSLISPFAVSASLVPDGKAMSVVWSAPDSRTGKKQWTKVGNSTVTDGTSGDYTSKDYYVAHAFDATDIVDSSMVGMSFHKVKAYLKANEGKFYAEIFRGTRDSHTLLASQEITQYVTADGGWVEADFSAVPVEIREGESYLVAIHCVGASGSPVGHGPSYSKVEGKNNLKWSETEYLYNGYYAWNISAQCDIPGCTDGTYAKPGIQLPPCTYSVYRVDCSDMEHPALLKENLPGASLSYVDNDWNHIVSGKYQYQVVADYGNGRQSLAAQSDTIIRSVDSDAGVVAILSPVKTIDIQTRASVKVRIKNFGEKPLTKVPVCVKLDDNTAVTATFEGNIAKGETADVEMGTVELVADTYYNIAAYTELDGDGMKENDTVRMVLPNLRDVNLRAFRWDAYGDAGLFSIHSNVAEQAEYIKEITPNNYLLNAAEYLGGRVYGFTATYNNVPGEFVQLDPSTWAPVASFPTSVYVMDMAYDYSTSTMFAIGVKDNAVALLRVDLSTGECTKVSALKNGFHTLACSTDGKLYAVADDGNLYALDKSSGSASIVGNTGVGDIKYIQTMAFDHNTDRLFWVHDGEYTAGELYELDPQTGAARQLGTVMFGGYPSCMIGMYVPYTPATSVDASAYSAGGFCAYFDGAGNLRLMLPQQGDADAQVEVSTVSGGVVGKVSVTGRDAVLRLSVPSGVYIVRVVLADGTSKTIKVRK